MSPPPKVITTFRQESVNNVHLSVLKSALQKSIRRSDWDVGLTALGYLSAFDDETAAGKRIRTNVTNRLIVCMAEEISINDWHLPIRMKALHDRWKNVRSDRALSCIVWVEMFTVLTNARKCRIVSDYKTRYNLPPYKMALDRLDALHGRLLSKYGVGDPEVTTLETFRSLLNQGADDCFVYVRNVLRNGKAKDLTMTLGIWTATLDAIRSPVLKDAARSLKAFHQMMSHAEKPIYLYHAILIALFQTRYNPQSDADLPSAATDDSAAMAEALANRTAQHDGAFPEYVYDRHTTENVSKKNSLDFALEGAFVTDEDKRFLNETYRAMYVDFKRLQNEKS